MKQKYWLSWWQNPEYGEFELHSPWWVSAFGDDGEAICAAIIAESEEEAKEMVYKSYDRRPVSLNWRFCETRANDWKPGDRFPMADWMVWPELI